MESNSKLYLLVLYIGFLAPFLLRGLTWAMLYVWTKNYPQVVGTCSGHHGQLISQNCVLTKIRAEPQVVIHVLGEGPKSLALNVHLRKIFAQK